MTIALLGFLAVAIALFLLGKFLLKDFYKFLKVKLKFYNVLPKTFVDLGQYAFTYLSVIIVALLGLLCLKSINALFSYFLATDLVDFYRLVRGVFSPEITSQSPFKTSHIISSLVLNPISQLVTVFLMTNTLRGFFRRINLRSSVPVYSESDTLIYGLASGILLIIIEILLYSQNITLISNVAHISYLVISKMSILVYFLVVSHTHLLNTDSYRNSLNSYLDMSTRLKKIVFSKVGVIGLSLTMGLVLSIPFFIGTQFLTNNLVLILILVGFLGSAYMLYKAGFTRALNCLGFVLLSEQHEELIPLKVNMKPEHKRLFSYLFLFISVLFIVIRFKSFFMGLVLMTITAIVIGIGFVLSYSGGLSFSLVRTRVLRVNSPKIEAQRVLKNSFQVYKNFMRSSLPIFILAWGVFMLISFKPHQVNYTNENLIQAVLDEQGEVLLAEQNDHHPSIAVNPQDVPEFLTTCLILQEDRDFLEQQNLLPSSAITISNWHGFSVASFYRILTGSGGGSNCNMQILKNLGTNGKAQDLQRKITEFYSAYQLSLSHTPDEILNFYLNTIAFNGGYGHSGIVQAAHNTFNKPLHSLNDLEIMYLIRTVVGGSFVVVDNEKILCKDASAYAEEIKQSLLRIATSWRNQKLISEGKFNQLKFAHLEFEAPRSEFGIQTTTREFLKKEINQLESEDHTLTSSISLENQRKVHSAVNAFEKKFHQQLEYKGCQLYSAAIAVDIKSGKIVGHHGGNGVTDLTNFGEGFPMASTIKPTLLLQALENEVIHESDRLYDGVINKDNNTPENYKTYSKKKLSINQIIATSPNAPIYNLKHQTDLIELIGSLEESFGKMPLKTHDKLDLSHRKTFKEIERKYALGQNKLLTVRDIAQVYQTILNDGVCVELNSIGAGFNSKTGKFHPTKPAKNHIFQKKNCQIIKSALHETVESGTAKRLKKHLNKDNTYYAKTGTSNGYIHGYTILSDGQTLIVSWVSYGKTEDGRIEFNDTPAIPHNSGGGSAGILAALMLEELNSKPDVNYQ